MAKFASDGSRADMKQGDIYFVSLDPIVGREQRGLRPVIVLTSEAFNRLTGSPLVAAITTGGGLCTPQQFRGRTADGRDEDDRDCEMRSGSNPGPCGAR